MVGRRLGGGSGPGPIPAASASYVCDSRLDLIVTLAGRDTSSSIAVSTSNLTNCSSQANTLSAHRSRLSNTALIGICDTQADLHRISLNVNGMISQIGETSMSNMSQCMDAASRMNSSLNIKQ